MLKRLELYWRRLWIRLLTGLMRRPAASIPTWGSRPHRVLFLRHDRVGDMIFSTAVMRAIAKSHPGIQLDVLASPANAAVLDEASYVSNVLVFDKRNGMSYPAVARRLRARRYDAVIDCMVTAPSVTTLMLMLAANAPYRIGIAGRGNDEAINVAVPPAPGQPKMTVRLGALAAAFGIDPSTRDWAPELDVSPGSREAAAARWREAGRGASAAGTNSFAEFTTSEARGLRMTGGQRVLVNVSAGTPARRWQTDKYVAVIQHLRTRLPDAIILITGAPNEQDRVNEVAVKSSATAANTPTLKDVFALVATADFVFTPETSIAHAAWAFRRPAVSLCRVTIAELWGLDPEIGENVEHWDHTLVTLEVEPVVAAIDRVLARRG